MTTVRELHEAITDTVESLSHVHPALFEDFVRWEIDNLVTVGMPVQVEEDGQLKVAEVLGCDIETVEGELSVSIRAWVPPNGAHLQLDV